MREELCYCGQPLHYSDPKYRVMVEELIKAAGDPYITVRVIGRAWRVPRHYIALHGLKAMELPFLGFEEVACE